ncbi:MAG TPA: YerC/YecD family TrpR-related protein [Candidatus Peribacteraceae bacterium]|nr:YerC/YecD family TrpR-related protein [Candidatus Peribacteraceae bacterium]
MALSKKHLRELYELFAVLRNTKEAELLLEDILTPQERESLAERWQIVRALLQGKKQRAIASSLKVSISKITRASRALQYGTGGFRHFFKKLHKTGR